MGKRRQIDVPHDEWSAAVRIVRVLMSCGFDRQRCARTLGYAMAWVLSQ